MCHEFHSYFVSPHVSPSRMATIEPIRIRFLPQSMRRKMLPLSFLS